MEKRSRLKSNILFFVLGLLVMAATTYAAYKYQASEIGYTPSNANFDVDNVSDAIKELYEKYENGGSGGGNTSTDILGNMENSSNFLPTGYYKSMADDNNVIFGGYCWKIIRKTDDDDIRILYNGLPQDGECTREGTDTQIDTSKYSDDSTITNYADSKVKTVVDNWYNNNLATNYSDKISTVDLITREEASNVSGGGYLVSGQSYWTKTGAGGSVTTTASCTISTSSGGGCNATPSGNVSSSTVYIVDAEGGVTSNNNGSYSASLGGSCSYCTTWQYKYSNGTCNHCTGTGTYAPKSYNTGCSCCSNSTYTGSCTASASGSSLAVRPVISLKNTVALQAGNGKSTSPYYVG